MATLTEHQNRLRHLICCIAEKTEAVSTSLLLGLKNKECALQELQLLVAFEDALKCHIPVGHVIGESCTGEVLGSVTFEFSTVTISNGLTVLFTINGVTIYTHTYSPAATIEKIYIDLKAGLEALGYTVNGSLVGDSYVITISLPEGTGDSYNNLVANLSVSGGKNNLDASETILGGVDATCVDILQTEDDNCLTEDEVETMFDYISSKCDICFKPYGDT